MWEPQVTHQNSVRGLSMCQWIVREDLQDQHGVKWPELSAVSQPSFLCFISQFSRFLHLISFPTKIPEELGAPGRVSPLTCSLCLCWEELTQRLIFILLPSVLPQIWEFTQTIFGKICLAKLLRRDSIKILITLPNWNSFGLDSSSSKFLRLDHCFYI